MNPYTPPAASLGQVPQHRHPHVYFLLGMVLTQCIWMLTGATHLYFFAKMGYISGTSMLAAYVGFGLLYAGTFAFFSDRCRGRNLLLAAALMFGLSHLGVNMLYVIAGPIELGLLAAVAGCWLVIKARASLAAAPSDQAAIVRPVPPHAYFVLGTALAQFTWMLTLLRPWYSLVLTGSLHPVAALACAIGLVLFYTGAIVLVRHGTRGRNFFIAAAVLLGLSLTGIKLTYFATPPIWVALGAAVFGCWIAIKATKNQP